MKNSSSLIALLLCFCLSFGQSNDKQKIIRELTAVIENYRNPHYLSFDILYTYANEKQPSVLLDTLKGSFKISGVQYWYSLDQTEAVGDSHYVVMLFKDDQVMYITKPSAVSVTQNPVVLMDSVLLNSDSIQAYWSSTPKQKRITIQFSPGMKYKTIEYEIDPSNFITKMKCIVRANELYDPSVKELIEDSDTYAIIETTFKNYKRGGVYTNQLDVKKYFKKEGNEFIPLPPFENYKIFLGSTNL